MYTRLYQIVIVALLGVSAQLSQAQVSASDAAVRLPVPGQSNAALYLTLSNRADEPFVLTDVTCACAERAELHSHRHEDGMMKMRKESSLKLPAGQSVILEPGGWHIMLFGLNRSIRTGDTVEFVLSFSEGHTVTVQARAESLYDRDNHRHHH